MLLPHGVWVTETSLPVAPLGGITPSDTCVNAPTHYVHVCPIQNSKGATVSSCFGGYTFNFGPSKGNKSANKKLLLSKQLNIERYKTVVVENSVQKHGGHIIRKIFKRTPSNINNMWNNMWNRNVCITELIQIC